MLLPKIRPRALDGATGEQLLITKQQLPVSCYELLPSAFGGPSLASTF